MQKRLGGKSGKYLINKYPKYLSPAALINDLYVAIVWSGAYKVLLTNGFSGYNRKRKETNTTKPLFLSLCFSRSFHVLLHSRMLWGFWSLLPATQWTTCDKEHLSPRPWYSCSTPRLLVPRYSSVQVLIFNDVVDVAVTCVFVVESCQKWLYL